MDEMMTGAVSAIAVNSIVALRAVVDACAGPGICKSGDHVRQEHVLRALADALGLQ